ncbi:uncharacterized protein LOC111189180 [Astyanax mexicanus]|uniref:uncharacterized protein LOC111189180 n=1 Tax=Astyanax mexicanus TaxID=7994 RepID=UPI0020CAD9F6|nr:uncharacterized protein LOC111189180 [Astyanax mexicanus]
MTDFLSSAIDRALQSESGHLDLFLRFLLGLSLESNQTLLGVLLTPTERISHSNKTVQYIKERIEENSSPEKSINLFHCLNELNDHSLVQEVQKYLSGGGERRLQKARLSPAQWSALVFVLLNSEEELEEFNLSKYDPSEECLLRLLPVVKIFRRAVLASCNLGVKTCENLESVLNLENSSLKELDLSNNDLQDSGVELLSAGLKSSQCKLQILRLSGCMITDKGCCSLASALIANPSHLKELDLTYNHPGESGVKLLSARLEDPHCKLEKLGVEHGGKIRIKPGLKKYGCDFTLDLNTVQCNLSLSEENRRVEFRAELQSYPDHPERFDGWCPQVLSRERVTGVTGRCYWEAEWSGGGAEVALSYKTISRKGGGSDCGFGGNLNSWSLFCSDYRYSVLHNNNRTDLSTPPSGCRRVGVYVDCPSGTLSFYRVSSDTPSHTHTHTHTPSHTLTHLHTFYTTFTQPLYAGIRVNPGSSVRLCKID